MKLTNKQYDTVKWFAQYFLPAFGTLYFALASIWNLPKGEEVVGTVTAITAFLGVILGISSSAYSKTKANAGELIINTTDVEKDIFSLEFTTHPEELIGKDEVTFKVKGS